MGTKMEPIPDGAAFQNRRANLGPSVPSYYNGAGGYELYAVNQTTFWKSACQKVRPLPLRPPSPSSPSTPAASAPPAHPAAADPALPPRVRLAAFLAAADRRSSRCSQEGQHANDQATHQRESQPTGPHHPLGPLPAQRQRSPRQHTPVPRRIQGLPELSDEPAVRCDAAGPGHPGAWHSRQPLGRRLRRRRRRRRRSVERPSRHSIFLPLSPALRLSRSLPAPVPLVPPLPRCAVPQYLTDGPLLLNDLQGVSHTHDFWSKCAPALTSYCSPACRAPSCSKKHTRLSPLPLRHAAVAVQP